MVKFKGTPRSCNIAVNISYRGDAKSLLLRIHADEIFSHPSARVKPISKQNI
jgi:hypothetical protein